MFLDFNHKLGFSTKTLLMFADVSACSDSHRAGLSGLEQFELLLGVRIALFTIQFFGFRDFHIETLNSETRLENPYKATLESG